MELPARTIPEGIQLLSAFSDNVSSFYHPGRLFVQAYTQDPAIPKLLNALAFFLRTAAEKERVAVTLGVTAQHALLTVVITLATQNKTTLPLDDSPCTILENVWKYMAACSSAPPDPEANAEFASYLLRIHFPLLVQRFNKRCKQYQQYREVTRRPEVSAKLATRHFAVKRYLEGADLIYEAANAFCAGPVNRPSVMKFMAILPNCLSHSREAVESGQCGVKKMAKLRLRANIEGVYLSVVKKIIIHVLRL